MIGYARKENFQNILLKTIAGITAHNLRIKYSMTLSSGRNPTDLKYLVIILLKFQKQTMFW